MFVIQNEELIDDRVFQADNALDTEVLANDRVGLDGFIDDSVNSGVGFNQLDGRILNTGNRLLFNNNVLGDVGFIG